MKTTVCYIIQLFPVPTETFIVEEVASVMAAGGDAYLLYLNENDAKATHPAVARLRESRRSQLFGEFGRLQTFGAVMQLLLRQPLRTFRALREASRSPERWRWMQVAPRALWCLQHGVTNIHAHFADLNLVYARLLSGWTGLPYGVTTHRYDILDDPLPLKLASDLMQGANPLITVSQFNRNLMRTKFTLDENHIHVVHCGVDLSRFSTASSPPPAEGPLRLVSVGRLAHQKGHDILLRSLAKARDSGLEFQLELIGDGPDRRSLEALVGELGLQQQVLLRGVQPEQEIVQALHRAELFVMASRTEGIPVACMESMACGVPVLTTRIMGLPELVQHGVTGYLAEPEDVSSFTEALLLAGRQRTELRQLGTRARAHVAVEFSRPGCTDELLALFGAANPRDSAALG